MAFSSILESMDDDDCTDELSSSASKKRRLSVEQVRALEKSFEVENKLDPERKVRLAHELSLQPRQVAVWFQNRRARWKTKQLERDYNALKASFDALRSDYDALQDDNQALVTEIKKLKAKLVDDESNYDDSEPAASPEKASDIVEEETPPLIYKDGSSDSDSSGILNGDASPYDNAAPVAPAVFDGAAAGNAKGLGFSFHQLLKAEEYDETCTTSWFSDVQPPTLAWCSDSWNWTEEGGGGDIAKKEGPF